MSGQLLLINPRKRRSKAKRAAPKRAKRRTHHRRHAAPVVMANPAPRRRRSRLHAVKSRIKHARRKYKRNPSARFSSNLIMGMAKTAAIGAAGAVVVDVAFGYAQSMLPTNMQTPVDATGSLNPLYFLAKGGLAVALGVLGHKATKHAGQMAEGSLTVSAYQILRSMVPASVNLGYVSPARPVGRMPARQAAPQLGKYVSGMDQYVSGGMAGYKPPVNGAKYMGG
jgi:hypothetical protein